MYKNMLKWLLIKAAELFFLANFVVGIEENVWILG